MHPSDLFARPGCFFEPATGRLYEYDGAEVTVFFPWPEMVAFRRQILDDAWKSLVPDVRLPAGSNEPAGEVASGVRESVPRQAAPGAAPLPVTRAAHAEPDDRGTDADARRLYWDQVPANARRVVAPYAEGHWTLLAWMARTGDAAQDLALSNPSLAFALACYPRFRASRGRPVEAYAPPLLVYEKQRQILGWLGFPPTDAVRRILQKVEHRAIDAQRLLALRPRLADEGVRQRLAHVPRIDKTVLRMAGDGSLLAVTPRMLRDIATGELERPDRRALALLHDVVRMWRQLRPRAPLPPFHRFARIGEVHDHLAEEVTRQPPISRAVADLPAPPFSGTDAIVALTTLRELIEEGHAQHNCVASYFGSVTRGYRAIYRVLQPERATLSLVRRRGGAWRIEQLKGPCNANVHPETRRAIKLWLDARM